MSATQTLRLSTAAPPKPPADPSAPIEIASSHGEGLQKYIPATSIEVAQRRLHKLAETLGASLQASDDALKRAGGRTGGNIDRGAAVEAVRAERDSR